MATEDRPEFRFNILTYREDGSFVAHCLELDLVECAENADQAVQNLIDVIGFQIACAIRDDDLEHLFRSAPLEVWKRMFSAKPVDYREIPIPDLDHQYAEATRPWINLCRLEDRQAVA